MNLKLLPKCISHLVFLSVVVMMIGCQDDDPRVDPKNPTALSNGIVIPESTRVASDFPTPSSDPAAPVLKVTTESVFVIGSFYKNLFLPLASGKAVGFYIKIKGANDYFKVTSTNAYFSAESPPSGDSVG